MTIGGIRPLVAIAGAAGLSCSGARAIAPYAPTGPLTLVVATSPGDHGAIEGREDPACPPETYWDGCGGGTPRTCYVRRMGWPDMRAEQHFFAPARIG